MRTRNHRTRRTPNAGRWLKRIRRAQERTLHGSGTALGCSASCLHEYEDGHLPTRPEALRAYVELLGETFDTFVSLFPEVRHAYQDAYGDVLEFLRMKDRANIRRIADETQTTCCTAGGV